MKIEAQEFYKYGDWARRQIIPTAHDLNDCLKRELRNYQVEDQVIYLKEVIRLIDFDAQEHMKTCKKQENPNECPDYQFYAKSRYYAAQILDSLKENNESIEANYELNKNLSKETFSAIEDLLNGKKHSLTKDSPDEITAIIERLNNLGFLTKVNAYSYVMSHDNRKYLAKLLELKYWNNFEEWLSEEEDSREASVTNIFKESSVGQFNQAVAGSIINNPKSKNQESSKTSLLNKLYWIIGIIVSLIVVYEFVIKQLIR